MCDMFLILTIAYFTGYTDDKTPFAVADNIEDVIRFLEDVGENFITHHLIFLKSNESS